MVRCCAFGCNNNSDRKNCSTPGPHSFHRFPAENPLRALWIHKINRKDFTPGKRSVVCSDHFESTCYRNHGKGRSLKEDSVPTVFGGAVKRKIESSGSTTVSPEKKRTCPENPDDLNKSFSLLEIDSAESVGRNSKKLENKIAELELQLGLASARIQELETEVQVRDVRIMELENLLHKDIEEPLISTNKLKNLSDHLFRRFTGVVSTEIFNDLAEIFRVAISSASYKESQKGAPHPERRKLSVEDQFLLILFKLRMDLSFEFLGVLFKIHCSTASKIFEMWICTMATVIRRINFFPSRQMVLADAPPEFLASGFADVRVLIDCFELFIEKPSHPGTHSYAYSSYKHHTTVKYLIGITPSARASFLSEGFMGSKSDEAILSDSQLLDLLESGDSIMADKGFRMAPKEANRGIELLTPDFLGPRTQLSAQEMTNRRNSSGVISGSSVLVSSYPATRASKQPLGSSTLTKLPLV
ncbi:uncharacterized protein LOC129587227 isoform X2 [Paramacrobiotus metropolitanus]|uniref:uncharacterized protein LOC129587227 isoform X2 n=1 Tax=Paramacrobiotus metropolitanus TaxID=2943436 RepID=UPI00244627FC|nr:uncharacterized protein LOC129587227 isoform X2 [Paramacrobiotus metropolitanus]